MTPAPEIQEEWKEQSGTVREEEAQGEYGPDTWDWWARGKEEEETL